MDAPINVRLDREAKKLVPCEKHLLRHPKTGKCIKCENRDLDELRVWHRALFPNVAIEGLEAERICRRLLQAGIQQQWFSNNTFGLYMKLYHPELFVDPAKEAKKVQKGGTSTTATTTRAQKDAISYIFVEDMKSGDLVLVAGADSEFGEGSTLLEQALDSNINWKAYKFVAQPVHVGQNVYLPHVSVDGPLKKYAKLPPYVGVGGPDQLKEVRAAFTSLVTKAITNIDGLGDYTYQLKIDASKYKPVEKENIILLTQIQVPAGELPNHYYIGIVERGGTKISDALHYRLHTFILPSPNEYYVPLPAFKAAITKISRAYLTAKDETADIDRLMRQAKLAEGPMPIPPGSKRNEPASQTFSFKEPPVERSQKRPDTKVTNEITVRYGANNTGFQIICGNEVKKSFPSVVKQVLSDKDRVVVILEGNFVVYIGPTNNRDTKIAFDAFYGFTLASNEIPEVLRGQILVTNLTAYDLLNRISVSRANYNQNNYTAVADLQIFEATPLCT